MHILGLHFTSNTLVANIFNLQLLIVRNNIKVNLDINIIKDMYDNSII